MPDTYVIDLAVANVALGGCPRITTHPSVGVGLSAWMSPLALFCWLGYHLNTARETCPMPYPPSQAHWSAMSVALTSLNRLQGTSIAPQLE